MESKKLEVKHDTAEHEIALYEKETGQQLPVHNRATLRNMIVKENAWWDAEEQRNLKDSNRYHDDN